MSTGNIENIDSVGSRLREERKRLEMTQEAFASFASVAVQTQRSYEAGRREPGASYLVSIAAAGADVSYILTGVRTGVPQAQPLTREEECLLDNYRHSDETGRAAMRATGAAFAQSELVKKSGRKVG
ncbi:MAG: helix-turn-helix transcriptional regulator [Magnetococcales bacterium]|nr:helix-turn-helix transcriptional regulator [Magnetococcales bacterium]